MAKAAQFRGRGKLLLGPGVDAGSGDFEWGTLTSDALPYEDARVQLDGLQADPDSGDFPTYTISNSLGYSLCQHQRIVVWKRETRPADTTNDGEGNDLRQPQWFILAPEMTQVQVVTDIRCNVNGSIVVVKRNLLVPSRMTQETETELP